MTRSPRTRRCLAALAVLAATGTAQAALTAYSSQADFLAAVATSGVDSFDDLSTASSTPSPLARSAGSFGYTATASTQGFFGAGTSPDVWLTTDQFTDTITFDGFGSDVVAIGGFFFGTDLFGGELPGQSLIVDVTDSDGTTSFTISAATSGGFQGWLSSGTLVSMVVRAVQSDITNVWPTVDDLVLAAGDGGTVPEPASLTLALLALTAAGTRRRSA